VFNNRIAGIVRLFSIEINKLSKNKAVYITIMVLVTLVAALASVPANTYKSLVASQEKSIQEMSEKIDAGFPLTISAWPEGYNPADYPLVDAEGNLIKENAELYKRFLREHLEAQNNGLTSEGGRYSFLNLMSQGARQGAGIVAILSLGVAISLFAGDFNRGAYRLMVSRGARRSNIITAKALAAGAIAVAVSLIATITILVTLRLLYQGFGTPHPAIFSIGDLGNIFWVFFLIALVYMALGGFFAMLLASSGSSMAVGLVWGFISVGFFSVTPCGEGLLSIISPATIGYNAGSLMYNMWPGATLITGASAEQECYRTTSLAISLMLGYAAVFTAAIYAIFNRKELKG